MAVHNLCLFYVVFNINAHFFRPMRMKYISVAGIQNSLGPIRLMTPKFSSNQGTITCDTISFLSCDIGEKRFMMMRFRGDMMMTRQVSYRYVFGITRGRFAAWIFFQFQNTIS